MSGELEKRASDAEREQVVGRLRDASSEGRLTLEEGEERLGRLYEARYRDELPPLTADLPDGGRRALFETPEVKAAFEKHARRHFAGHAGFVAVIAAVLVGLWALSHAHFFLSRPKAGGPPGVGLGAGFACFSWAGYWFSCWANAVPVAPRSSRANSEIMAVNFIAFTSWSCGFSSTSRFEWAVYRSRASSSYTGCDWPPR